MKQPSQLEFILAAFKDYKVGAWSPSSPYLVRRVLKNVPNTARIIVEFGPGEGVMTRALLKRLPEDGVLYVIEQNVSFAEKLSKISDERLHVICGSAEKVMAQHTKYRIPKADVILSSIPFSFLKPKERELLTGNAYKHLKRGGLCIVFHQYYPHAKRVLEKVFGTAVVSYEWRNFLPCFVFIAKK